ncbi:MAG: adenylate/guanylate cyclase domain-containing protein, partial [Spirochaetaceae bacterium]|nr:adenylate/guanylate cyclase domain-containing protein [Spirochaetaceae bacterium]
MVAKKETSPETQRVRFPIGAKLLAIISLITLVSLGTLTVLASALMRQDVQITAEENNFTVNKRSAAEAEAALRSARSGANVLLNIS